MCGSATVVLESLQYGSLTNDSTFVLIVSVCSLVNQTTPSVPLDVVHHQHERKVMQYIQHCGGSGLVYMTVVSAALI